MENKISLALNFIKRVITTVFIVMIVLLGYILYTDKAIDSEFLSGIVAPTENNSRTYRNDVKQAKYINSEDAKPVFNVYTDGIEVDENTQKIDENQIVDVIKVDDTLDGYFTSDIVGTDSVKYQIEENSGSVEGHFPTNNLTMENIEELKNIEVLRKNFYTVDKLTDITEDLFDVTKFVSTDLSIDHSSSEPKILIFHTHAASEGFSDSDPNNLSDGIVGVGDRLAEILYNDYGIGVIHVTSKFDINENGIDRNGAYERMEVEIQKIINENPSIEVAIDLHRDGVNPDVRLVTEVDGKPTAKIMFFNGLSRMYKDGKLENVEFLENNNLETNLAFSFNMQLKANELYPDFTRKIYLKAFRYSLHMLPKSLLIEVGAQTNTKEEAFNTAQPIAKILSEVIK